MDRRLNSARMLMRNDSLRVAPCVLPRPTRRSVEGIATTRLRWTGASEAQCDAPSAAPCEAPKAATMRRVALLIETSGSYGRGLLQGISKYNRERGEWSTCFRPYSLNDVTPAWLKSWRGDGLLLRIDAADLAGVAKRSGAAIVNLRGAAPGSPFANVTVDEAQVAKLASQHLIERGLEHFAFCGRPRGQNPALDERGEQFRRLIERAGNVCHMYPDATAPARDEWDVEQSRLTAWIASLPKPIGIMACNDERGLQVLDACRRCGAAVPDDVAVIGVDNDPSLCELAIPPLSSIDVNAEGIGYEAAAVLDRMMNGEAAPSAPVKLSPRGVVTRRSSDVVASEDEEVSRAVRYIREHACGGLQVADVLGFMGISRASLQQRMKRLLGRTVHQEIQRVRLSRAKELLAMSPLTIKQVARESGFASVQYMTRVFRAATTETPARYRHRRTA
jgi:LacI family transcriptional regulator